MHCFASSKNGSSGISSTQRAPALFCMAVRMSSSVSTEVGSSDARPFAKMSRRMKWMRDPPTSSLVLMSSELPASAEDTDAAYLCRSCRMTPPCAAGFSGCPSPSIASSACAAVRLATWAMTRQRHRLAQQQGGTHRWPQQGQAGGFGCAEPRWTKQCVTAPTCYNGWPLRRTLGGSGRMQPRRRARHEWTACVGCPLGNDSPHLRNINSVQH